ncbi:glycosyltransferase [Streptomyces sp. SID8379]|uniref:glycosyltransferase family 2 protein n=1 Tax=unclassified Streptomyces TaxID=2593676 RepID=UPI0003AA249A|nr:MULTISPECIES: cellulose synthase catalytic subunit [unclassified Streptomyces]MYW68298.1 glycosyltransferase [Streptomyces sp. SID8379]
MSSSGSVRTGGRRAAHRREHQQFGLLPLPPSDREKYSYTRRRLWILTISSLISFGCLAVSQVELARSAPVLWVYAPLLVFTVVYYLVSLRVNGFTRDFDIKRHRRLVRNWRPETYPSVDVFLPVCGEPIAVLHNTWRHVRAMADRYPGVCVPFVLDDRASPELAAMARDFGFRYGTRENRGWFKKAGNLHFGFGRSDGTYILILDADFTPRADLLEELLPYPEADARIGIVQSPQYFRVLDSQNWIERGAGAVQELFYRSVQVSRQGSDGAICVGSCAVYRRAALETNGGTTLIEHSEDVHTGFDLRGLGWDLRYVPVAVSTGVCPDSASAFFNQQYRWCSGSMSLLGSRKFWQRKIKLSSRLCYLSGFFYYIHTALFTFAAPVIPLVLLFAMPGKLLIENLALVLPSIVYTTIVFPMWHKAPYRLEAWAARMMYGWAHVFAIWDILRRNRMGWLPTGSSGARENRTRRFWVGMWAWSGGTAALWVGAAVWRMSTMNAPDFVLILSSGLFYALVVGRVLVQPRAESAV